MALNSLKKRKRNRDALKVYFSEEEEEYLVKKAATTKKTLSQLIREFTVAGIFAEKFEEIEERLEQATTRLAGGPQNSPLPVEVIRSVFFVEAMLKEAWKAQDVQVIYRAQQEANQKIGAVEGKA